MNRGPDALVGAAAADVRHRRVDLSVGRLWFLAEQCGRGHDLARLAVAALRHVLGDPGLLHPVRRVGAEAFDRRDAAGTDRGDRHDAGANRLAVDVYGAGAALGDPAAE